MLETIAIGDAVAQQSTPPASPRSLAKPLPILTKSNSGDDLAARCRQLARSAGKNAVHELTELPPSPTLSATPTLSPTRSHSSSPSLRHAPASPSAAFGPRSLSLGTPEAFHLEEILEEGQEGDSAGRQRVRSAEGSAATDESGSESEMSSSMRRGRKAQGGANRMGGGLGLFSAGEPLKKSSSRSDNGQNLRHALQQGLTSLYVEVRLVNGELLVESAQPVLSLGQTLSELCLDPLLEHFESLQPSSSSRRSSMTATRVPFQLVIKLASSPTMTFQYLLHALTNLNDSSFLTSYCLKSAYTTQGLMTVSCVGEGDEIPLDEITSLTPRYVFVQAPLKDLEASEGERWNTQISPLAGGNLKELTGWDGSHPASEEQIGLIEQQVKEAHKRKMKVRYSDLPRWPIHAKELVQETLKELEVDYV